MQLSETKNVFATQLRTRDGVEGKELNIICHNHGIALDQTTAAELLPILEHFIKTGELPE